MPAYVADLQVFLSDITQSRRDTLTPATPTDATFLLNDDLATKRQASLVTRYPDSLRRFEDWLLFTLTITRDDGWSQSLNLGHYVVVGHETATGNSAREGTVHLRDLSYLLHREGFATPQTVAAGTDPGQAARDLLTQWGVPSTILTIPDAGVTLTADLRSQPDDTVLSFVTDVLAGGRMYQPWQDDQMRLTSRVARDIRSATPDASYGDGEAAILPPVKEPLSDPERTANTVRVVRELPGEEPIVGEATVTDRSSALHPDTLAARLGKSQPVYWVKTYPEPAITSEEEATALAQARLSEAASWYQTLSLTTYPDAALDGHQVLELAVTYPGDGQTYYDGRWWQRAWELRWNGGQPIVTRTVNRTVSWQ